MLAGRADRAAARVARAGTRRPSPTASRPCGGRAVPTRSRWDATPTRRHSAASSSTSRTGRVGSAKIAVPTWTATAPTARKSRTSSELGHAADRDDRDGHGLGRLVDDPQRHGLDRRPTQAAVDVAEQRPAAVGRHGDARQGVDRGQRVGPRVGDGPRDRPDVGDVRRQLDEQRQVGRASDGGRDLAGGAGIDGELEPAPADVRARDVELDPGDAGHAIESARDLDVVLDRFPGHVDDDRRPASRPTSSAYLSMTASTPGFWRPIELSIPPGVSVTRGVGLPMRARRVVPLQQIPPSRSTSTTSPYSTP